MVLTISLAIQPLSQYNRVGEGAIMGDEIRAVF